MCRGLDSATEVPFNVSGSAPPRYLHAVVQAFDGPVDTGTAIGGTESVTWEVRNVSVPRTLFVNGKYKVENVSVCPNHRPTGTNSGSPNTSILDFYESPIPAGCILTILEEPVTSEDPPEGSLITFGTPFGYDRVSSLSPLN